MRSIKIASLLVVVVAAAIAIAAPAGASAAVIEMPAGQPAPNGAKFTMTSTNLTWATAWGNAKCSTMTLPGLVTQNNGTVKVAGGLGSANTCAIGSSSITVQPELRGLTLFSPLMGGKMDLKLSIQYPGASCVLEGTEIPVYYSAGSSEFGVVNGKVKAIPAACGPGTLNGKFSLSSIVGPPVLN